MTVIQLPKVRINDGYRRYLETTLLGSPEKIGEIKKNRNRNKTIMTRGKLGIAKVINTEMTLKTILDNHEPRNNSPIA